MSDKPEILITVELPPLIAALSEDFIVHRARAVPDLGAFLKDRGAAIRGVVTYGALGLATQHVDLMPNLAVVALFSAGYENLDIDALAARGVPVTTCSGVNAGDVADLAFGLLLAVAREISAGDRFIRAGRWSDKERMGLRDGVWGSTLGILGLGAIGAELVKRAKGFEMNVLYHNRRPRADVAAVHVPDLVDLARQSDHLVIACPLTQETRHKVDASVLNALGPAGILINVARGEVVDERALIAALETGVIRGAGLDVFAQEPEVPEALRRLDNVVLTPHVGGFTRRVFRDMGARVQDNLRRALAGAPLAGVVNGVGQS